MPQPITGESLSRSQGIDDFVELQTIFLSMNHQIAVVELPTFNQKRHSMLTPSTPFSVLPRSSLPQTSGRASLTPSLRIENFVELQTIFLSMKHQIATVESPTFDQKRHSMLTPSTPYSILSSSSLPQLRTGALMTHSRIIEDFVGFEQYF
jgi:hypothetical protein